MINHNYTLNCLKRQKEILAKRLRKTCRYEKKKSPTETTALSIIYRSRQPQSSITGIDAIFMIQEECFSNLIF